MHPSFQYPPLSLQEMQILLAFMYGEHWTQTAKRLDTTALGIYRSAERAKTKLKCATVAQAAAKATFLGLIEPDVHEILRDR